MKTAALQPQYLPFPSGNCVATMVANVTDCSFFSRYFKQSKTAVRLKEDMKKIVAVPLPKQRNPAYTKLFGVSLQDLHRQGLTENGVPAIVGSIVEYLTLHGESSRVVWLCCFYKRMCQCEFTMHY